MDRKLLFLMVFFVENKKEKENEFNSLVIMITDVMQNMTLSESENLILHFSTTSSLSVIDFKEEM